MIPIIIAIAGTVVQLLIAAFYYGSTTQRVARLETDMINNGEEHKSFRETGRMLVKIDTKLNFLLQDRGKNTTPVWEDSR
jgi:hypothetical protein